MSVLPFTLLDHRPLKMASVNFLSPPNPEKFMSTVSESFFPIRKESLSGHLTICLPQPCFIKYMDWDKAWGWQKGISIMRVIMVLSIRVILNWKPDYTTFFITFQWPYTNHRIQEKIFLMEYKIIQSLDPGGLSYFLSNRLSTHLNWSAHVCSWHEILQLCAITHTGPLPWQGNTSNSAFTHPLTLS